MSTTSNAADVKSNRLRKYFADTTNGKRTIKTKNDARLFIEAICDQDNQADCIEKLVTAPDGLRALKQSLRADLSNDFINNTSTAFLNYIASDSVRQLGNGKLLQEVLESIVEPSLFWSALKEAFDRRKLSIDGIHGFACLLVDLLTFSSPSWDQLDVVNVAEAALIPAGGLLDSSNADIRMIAYKIQDSLRSRKITSIRNTADVFKAGGRHDNDFEDFRQVAIFPTRDEFLATEQPFYLTSDTVFGTPPEDRVAVHLDNQFRLLREDLLAELRNDISKTSKSNKGKRPSLRLKNLTFHGVDCGDFKRPKQATIALQCREGLPKLVGKDDAQRKKHYTDNKTLLKHQSFGCLLYLGDIVAFATVHRDTDMLALDPPVILLQLFGDSALKKALITLKVARPQELEFVQVDTPYFAYEPVLKRLQQLPLLPLSDPLLGLSENAPTARSVVALDNLATRIRSNEGQSLRDILHLNEDIVLDHSQTESLATGLSQTLSLIQGPPGTGKSFLGAILARSLLKKTKETILVLCYTNHALDQFLEDILDMGVSENQMLRLGAKSTDRTQCLGLYEQSSNHRRSKQSFSLLNRYKEETDACAHEVNMKATEYRQLKISGEEILEYLQFSNDDSDFFNALSLPDNEDDMTKVGKKGKSMTSSYLISRWQRGLDAGVFKSGIEEQHRNIWEMNKSTRQSIYQRWTREFFSERAGMLSQSMDEHAQCYDKFINMTNERNTEIMRSKRIIGCTTTAAAKYSEMLSSAAPGIVLVEEAGEILESHVLTALSPSTKQVILIGDHQQLRPKVNSFALTVQKGDGYDLNKSLFERLVTTGYPHVTLAKQHRMRPEISALVKRLMYPDLQDDVKTLERPNLRGFQSNVIFFNHDHRETSIKDIPDRRDESSKISRENLFEVEMVLKTVRYLAQQGYGTEKQVVLTPYLGQLALLLKHLRADHDPILNDLDSFDLVKAGLLPQMSASVAKRPLRISTIDNFQGEEKEVVIVSLTRGNDEGDIGFMAEAQRLNVLLSRARDGLIIIGNANTFEKSRKGNSVWRPFLEQVAQAGQLYDGLPLKCERHPHKVSLIKTKDEFDKYCPDGGCNEPCPTMLNCGKHLCPQRCHQLADHSKIQCKQILEGRCPQNHKITWECWEKSTPCTTCEQEALKLAAQRKRDHELEAQRRKHEQVYAQKLAEVEDEIKHELRLQHEHMNQLNRQRVLDQRRKDVEKARATTKDVLNKKKTSNSSPPNPTGSPVQNAGAQNSEAESSSSSESLNVIGSSHGRTQVISKAKEEWEYQKSCENADNEHIDALMEMIGLEAVKQQFLTIKAKIDTSIRQGVNLQSERFGAVLLGNPGTGKTTVARLYAKFLASVGVLSGMTVKETTAARLTDGGVRKCQTLIDEVLSAGGGAIFIDEAYQLSSKTNPGGAQILDFLLPEVENLTGKVVFILAGYRKQMESFFAYNPGLPSRFPKEVQFNDYDDAELLRILGYQINKRFGGRMKIENGIEGLYCRIAARRVGYGRGREGFGNARTIENAFSRICDRQATRLKSERRSGKKSDDMVFTKTDIIGPEPCKVLDANKSWAELQGLVGLDTVKQSVQVLLDTIQFNYQRELEEKPLLQFNLNKVFLGSPGTGKTTVAKLYGQILADIGLLSNGEVIVKNPSDFVSDVIGGSEKTTNGILASTVGKVLVIDEAYSLYSGHSNPSSKGGNVDAFRTSVIDTIVSVVQSVPGDDRCVLLLGYKDQMESMFQNVNPGLSRRFPLADAFEFQDFTDNELETILQDKLIRQGYSATNRAIKVSMEMLNRARNRPNFGNAGEVDILLNTAKSRHQKRLKKGTGKVKDTTMLEAVDIDPEFDRGERAETNVPKLFEDVIGCDELVSQLVGIQKTAANMKARGMDPREQIPFNVLFRGPPGKCKMTTKQDYKLQKVYMTKGTGKTTTARKMGKLYYDMGFLSAAEVLETSATDLIGEFIGQTGPKTQKLFEKALGRVLLIDEAYRLAEGQFAKEAMDEVVDCLTKPKFHQRMIVILAGYDQDINDLMSRNPGLTSRFPDAFTFRPLNPNECVTLFATRIRSKNVDVSSLETGGNQSSGFLQQLLLRFDTLSRTANWANGRDVRYLAKTVFGRIIRDADPGTKSRLCLDEATVISIFDTMIAERKGRERRGKSKVTEAAHSGMATQQNQPFNNNAGTKTGGSHGTNEETTVPPPQPSKNAPPPLQNIEGEQDIRDPNIDDTTWFTLLQDKKTAKEKESQYLALLNQQALLKAEHDLKTSQDTAFAEKHHQEEILSGQTSEEDWDDSATKIDEAKKAFEKERLEREMLRREREKVLEGLRLEKAKRDVEIAKEKVAQRKLKELGRCVQGFRWIRQSAGYRCAGGSHFLSHQQVDAL